MVKLNTIPESIKKTKPFIDDDTLKVTTLSTKNHITGFEVVCNSKVETFYVHPKTMDILETFKKVEQFIIKNEKNNKSTT